jgi:hypothetical protein
MDKQLVDTASQWRTEATAHEISTAFQGQPPPRLDHGKRRPVTPSKRMAALQAAWAAHTVKRAIAAVGSATDDDYHAFGWERGELLAKLQWLRKEIKQTNANRSIALTVTPARCARPHRLAPAPNQQSPTKCVPPTQGG